MRLGLLGPAGSDVGGLGRAAEFLLNGARVHRAVYLGADGALDRAVAAWARKLAFDDVSDEGAWSRAAQLAASGTPDELERFVQDERARQRLKALVALPDPPAKTLERVGDRAVLLVHDERLLNDEDLRRVELVGVGVTESLGVRAAGPCVIVAPGPIGRGGIAVVDDEGGRLRVTLHDPSGAVTFREELVHTRSAPPAGAT